MREGSGRAVEVNSLRTRPRQGQAHWNPGIGKMKVNHVTETRPWMLKATNTPVRHETSGKGLFVRVP